MPRFHCPLPIRAQAAFDLPAGAARHVQVLRLQPGAVITLFTGEAGQGQWQAEVLEMGRSHVRVQALTHEAIDCEHRRPVHLLAGITANERMDWLVEKATELGAASLTPLLAERSVLKLKGERGEKKREHWQAVAVAACEQCGRNQVPLLHPAVTLAQWLAAHPWPADESRAVLSLAPGSQPLLQAVPSDTGPVVLLSGPEGGLSPAEEAAALAAGFAPVTLGPRVLRAETAPLAALALLEADF